MCNSILELNDPRNILCIKLDEIAIDSSPLIEGTFKLYPDVDIQIDSMYDALLSPTPPDSTTQTYLEALVHSLLFILERQAADQLPGGVHSAQVLAVENLPAMFQQPTLSVRDILNMLLRMIPVASTHGLEALIMWANNKSLEWYRSLSPHDQQAYMDKAA